MLMYTNKRLRPHAQLNLDKVLFLQSTNNPGLFDLLCPLPAPALGALGANLEQLFHGDAHACEKMSMLKAARVH